MQLTREKKTKCKDPWSFTENIKNNKVPLPRGRPSFGKLLYTGMPPFLSASDAVEAADTVRYTSRGRLAQYSTRRVGVRMRGAHGAHYPTFRTFATQTAQVTRVH